MIRIRFRHLCAAALAALLLSTSTGSAEQAPATAVSATTAPVPAPAPAPAPVAAPVATKPDEPVTAPVPAPVPAAGGPTPPPSLADRVTAALAGFRGDDGSAATIAALRAQLATAQADVQRLSGENQTLRAEQTRIEETLRTVQTKAQSVETTVAGLGFPVAALPAAAPIEAVKEPADIYNEWQALKKNDPAAAAVFFNANEKTMRIYARTLPHTC